MTKQTIEIDVPEGWRAVAYRRPIMNVDYILLDGDVMLCDQDWLAEHLIIEKTRPRRIVLEDTGEIRKPKEGEYVYNNGNLCLCRKPERWGHEHQIWRIVEEE